MIKKYEITEETIQYEGRTLYRIKALRNFNDVSKGDLGGFIESEHNLSHDGNAWVYDDAKVFGDASVYGNAMVYGSARVFGNAMVFGNAEVFGTARVFVIADVFGIPEVFGNARVYGNARVFGDAEVSGNVEVTNGAYSKEKLNTRFAVEFYKMKRKMSL